MINEDCFRRGLRQRCQKPWEKPQQWSWCCSIDHTISDEQQLWTNLRSSVDIQVAKNSYVLALTAL